MTMRLVAACDREAAAISRRALSQYIPHRKDVRFLIIPGVAPSLLRRANPEFGRRCEQGFSRNILGILTQAPMLLIVTQGWQEVKWIYILSDEVWIIAATKKLGQKMTLCFNTDNQERILPHLWRGFPGLRDFASCPLRPSAAATECCPEAQERD